MQQGEFPVGGEVGVEIIRGQVKWFNTVKGFGFVKPDDGSGDVFLHLTCLRDFGHDSVSEGATIECEVAQRAKGKQAVRILNLDISTVQEGEVVGRPAGRGGSGDSGHWQDGRGGPRRDPGPRAGGHVGEHGFARPDRGGERGAGRFRDRGEAGFADRFQGDDSGRPSRGGRRPAEVIPEGEFMAATVKWFNPIRGYGFVLCRDYPQDVFLHMEVLRRAGMRDLEPGQDIEIRVGQGPKGLQVAEVRVAG